MAQDQVKVAFDVDISKAIAKIQDFEVALAGLAKKEQIVDIIVNYVPAQSGNQGLQQATKLKALYDQLGSSARSNFDIQKKIETELGKQAQQYRSSLVVAQQMLATGQLNAQQQKAVLESIKKTQKALAEMLKLSTANANSMREGAIQASYWGKALKDINGGGLKSLQDSLSSLVVKLSLGGIIVEGFKQSLAGIGNIISKGSDFQQLEIGLNAFAGSTEEATFLYKKFKDIALKTPFGLPDVAQAGKTLLAFGLSSEEAAQSLSLLSIGAGATGADLNNLARNLGQIKAQQRAFKRDLDQFATAGFGIYTALAEATGKNVEQVKELASEGKVGYTEVVAALNVLAGSQSNFAKVADQQLNTLAGQFGNLETAVSEFSGTLIKALTGPTISGINVLIQGLNLLGKNISNIITVAKALAISFVALKIGSLISLIVQLKGAFLAVVSTNILGFFKSSVPAVATFQRVLATTVGTAKLTATGLSLTSAQLNLLNAAALKAAIGVGILLAKFAVIIGVVTLATYAWDKWNKATAATEGVKQAAININAAKDAADSLGLALQKAGQSANIGKFTQIGLALKSFGENQKYIDQSREKFLKFAEAQRTVTGEQDLLNIVMNAFKSSANFGQLDNNFKEINKNQKEITTQFAAQSELAKALAAESTKNSSLATEQLGNIQLIVKEQQLALTLTKANLKTLVDQINQLKAQKEAQGGLSGDQQALLDKLISMRDTMTQNVTAMTNYANATKQAAAETAALAQQANAIDPKVKAQEELDIRKAQIDLAKIYWGVEKEGLEQEKGRLEERKAKIKETADARKQDIEDIAKKVDTYYQKEIARLGELKDKISNAYDAEIAKLQEKNRYEQQVIELEKKELEEKLKKGGLSEKETAEIKGRLQRMKDENTILDLQKQKKAETEAIEKKRKELQDQQTAAAEKYSQAIENIERAAEKQTQSIDRQTAAIDKQIQAGDRQLAIQEQLFGIDEKILEARLQGKDSLAAAYEAARGVLQATDSSKSSAEGMAAAFATGAEQFDMWMQHIAISSGEFDKWSSQIGRVATESATASTSAKELATSVTGAQAPMAAIESSSSNISSSTQTAATAMEAYAAAAQNAATASANIKPPPKRLGGPVIPGNLYEANEIGQEAFLGASGLLSLIRTDANSYWRAPERGTVIPAHLTRQLNIPESGIQVNPSSGKLASLNIAKTTEEAVNNAMLDIANSQNSQSVQLGKLTESIDNMAKKEWTVRVDIDNKTGQTLTSKFRRF